MDRIEMFHAHLGVCERCREQPSNLCPAGANFLVAAAQTVAKNARMGSNVHANMTPHRKDRKP